ncbi:hypothetical protein AVEN_183622-1 [Araneus ventricosus]|uniref:HTH CENPB-type domain-containing protein n=1 Tax=Araneus ventricosus TaxID=182803 RepID=A0A4Y2HPW4_ARAVE|nr:hypothetical protein AVEN_37388-1 [Araneus ventricosus]GBM41234.1 hypothetical protein AVEN_37390-1 [Araneus ventricosus]GBM67312.1 hypothetical protein AVEN_48197-1 [Araneus ventricosus]GBM67334.1 hypothetical protein AVEN_80958-1 [Araneus ventricosus]GBM67387.1 hypothetical protein AVEN_175812-1 [Araneus ventricosus]
MNKAVDPLMLMSVSIGVVSTIDTVILIIKFTFYLRGRMLQRIFSPLRRWLCSSKTDRPLASNGWLEKFRVHNNILFRALYGEAAENLCEGWTTRLPLLLA